MWHVTRCHLLPKRTSAIIHTAFHVYPEGTESPSVIEEDESDWDTPSTPLSFLDLYPCPYLDEGCGVGLDDDANGGCSLESLTSSLENDVTIVLWPG